MMMLYKKRIIFLITSLLVAFLLNSCAKKHVSIAENPLINSSEAKKSLHFSLQIDEFYSFLTRGENKDLKNFLQKNIKI